jgi:hypothetical protein
VPNFVAVKRAQRRGVAEVDAVLRGEHFTARSRSRTVSRRRAVRSRAEKMKRDPR